MDYINNRNLEWHMPRRGPSYTVSRLDWNSQVLGFCGGRKTGEPAGEKPPQQGQNQQQTQPTYDAGSRFEPGPQYNGGDERSH